MRTHHNILIGLLRTLDRSDDVVVGHGTHREVVANIELQLNVATLLSELVDALELSLVELDIGNGGQRLEGNLTLVEHLAIVQSADGHCRGLDETQYASLDHLVIEQSGHIVQLLRRVGVLTVVLCNLLVLLNGCLTSLACLHAVLQRPTRRAALHQHPSTLERTLHTVELIACAGLDNDVSALRALRTRGVRWGGEVQGLGELAHCATPPATAVEAYGHLANLLQLDLQAPLLELLYHPGLRVVKTCRADQSATEAVTQNVEMLHHAVILARNLHNLLYCCALCPYAEGQYQKSKKYKFLHCCLDFLTNQY